MDIAIVTLIDHHFVLITILATIALFTLANVVNNFVNRNKVVYWCDCCLPDDEAESLLEEDSEV